ncbi:hypothetical protein CDL12_08328 [Handroanthus impetiginosus]|uniref:Uncharacterized protein n=1 Tax=Handroanthus impetiginosus TaxID=429701 RepID=A0A2G9HNX5_9LAMI|nr:hypothetical protein CDL12_08328 [Handroanthus impetiginosus]
MEKKSLDFVVDTYLLNDDRHNCHVNRRSPIPVLQCHRVEDEEEFEDQLEHSTNGRGIDRLSALPDIICQHIVSFLPATDARRMSFLSRRWRFMWCACPSFTFDEREFHRHPPQWHRSQQNFIRFVDEALEFRKTYFNDLSIEKFKVSKRFAEEVSPCLESWIAFALERNVRELSVIAGMKDLIAIAEFFQPFRVPYQLPKGVFATKSVQCLELVFCDLTQVSASSIDLPLLKNLDLINVHMNDSVCILSSSPLLEKINLSLICGLEKIQISGEKLKMLVVFKCLPLEEVMVKAPTIESFLFRGKRQNPDKIDISSCRKLRFLWLKRASNLTDVIMILSHCSGLKNAVVNSPNLWMLVLFKCKHLSSAKIDAPNLRAFEYSGHMITFPSVVASSQLDAIIHMDGHNFCSRWYAKLKEMYLIVPHEMRKKLLPQLNGLRELKVHKRRGNMNLAQLEDGIQWIFPGLKNLYVESDGLTHHFQYSGAGEDEDVGATWRKCREFIKEGDRF